jgi:ABC-type uncharacterized transport system substrate-binding protein
MKQKDQKMNNTPVIFMHGFEHEQLIAIMRAAKKAAEELGMDASNIAFCSSTPNNTSWKVKDLIKEVQEEHDYMKKTPPKMG